jgi:iron complex outermembrane receptor protein
MSDREIKGNSLAAAVGAVLALSSYAAGAADVIQEVIVTAQKRAENLQTTPIAISAFSSEALQNRGITDFAGVAQSTPSINFSVYPSSSNTLIMYMRGQGVSDAAQITFDGSVALYEDGFYIARPEFTTYDLADVERVEVLRGPQGTLYGRNTTGGAVNLISKKPSGEFGFKEELDGGNLNYFRSLTSVNLPAWNGLSTKITVLDSHKDGWVKNIGPSNDFDLNRQRAGRLSLHWENSSAFTADYFYETAYRESTGPYYENASLAGVVPGYSSGAPSPRRTWRPVNLRPSADRFSMNGLTLTWNVSDALTIKSLTGYRVAHLDLFQDYADTFSNPAFGGATLYFTTNDIYSDHEFTQELQAVGDVFNHHLKYIAGLYYFREGGGHFEKVNFGLPAFGFNEEDNRYVRAYSKSQAVFGQATWTPPILDDRLELTVGGRYTKDKKSASRNYTLAVPPGSVFLSEFGVNNNQSFSKFNPAVTLAYNWSDDVNTYLRYATGYKAGGSTESAAIGSFGLTFGPENVKTYELGLKSYWLDRHVRFNTAIFRSKFNDMQFDFASDPNNAAIGLALNAGKATVQGAEVELLVQPVQDLSININWTYLHTKIDEISAPAGTVFDPAVNSFSPYVVGQNIADVFALPYAPKNAFNVGLDYDFLHLSASDLSAHLNYRWQAVTFVTATTGPAVPGRNNYTIPSYGVLDGRLSWAFNLKDNGRARVSLWSKNLLNKKYSVDTIGGGNFIATASGPAGWNYQSVTWAEPRSYGVNLTYEY